MADKGGKGLDNVGQITVNIGMIKFHGSENGLPGMEQEKLGPLIKKGGVVFIPFQDHIGPLPQAVIGLKVFDDAADHKARVQAGGKQQPGQEGRGGGFTVGAGDHQGLTLPHQVAVQGFGHGDMGESQAENFLGLGIVGPDDVADDRQVGPGLEMFRVVAVLHRDAELFQEGAHGRIGMFVGAGERKPCSLRMPARAAMPVPQMPRRWM